MGAGFARWAGRDLRGTGTGPGWVAVGSRVQWRPPRAHGSCCARALVEPVPRNRSQTKQRSTTSPSSVLRRWVPLTSRRSGAGQTMQG